MLFQSVPPKKGKERERKNVSRCLRIFELEKTLEAERLDSAAGKRELRFFYEDDRPAAEFAARAADDALAALGFATGVEAMTLSTSTSTGWWRMMRLVTGRWV